MIAASILLSLLYPKPHGDDARIEDVRERAARAD